MNKRATFVRLCSRPIPRVLRMMQVARELGLAPYFVGARREQELPLRDEWEGWEIERIGPYFPLLNGTRPLRYVVSVMRYGVALFVHLVRHRPSLVHVSDYELFWPARLYTLLAGVPLLYNIHDNLGQRYRCPRFIAAVLNGMEGVAARVATVTLVPEDFRRSALPAWCRANVRVVRNTPIDPGFSAPRPHSDGPIVLFFAGWLDGGRGIRQLTDLVSRQSSLLLRIAGDGDEALLSDVSGSKNVEYLGYLQHGEVMSRTAECDFVTALYDPVRPINRYAASNKIAEALAVGRPLITNEELMVARLLESNDCAVVVKYAEIAEIGDRLLRLRANEKEYEAMCARARRVYEEHYSWTTVREASISVFQAAGINLLDERRGSQGRQMSSQ